MQQSNNQSIDIEAWKDLLLRRELEAIDQTATLRAMMARIQELEAIQQRSPTDHQPETKDQKPKQGEENVPACQ